jgi:O-acetyl-ADP-ribose deacetylase (regulator of RNase III)
VPRLLDHILLRGRAVRLRERGRGVLAVPDVTGFGMNRIQVEQGDITRLQVVAIVNAANERMLGGGGVDGAIHRAAGPKLLQACRAVPEIRPGVRCPTGEARVTPGFRLPAQYVIHTVGPVWYGGTHGEDALLASCYRCSLALAAERAITSIAFPAISCGVYDFPAERACKIAVREVREHLAGTTPVQKVVLVAFDGAMALQMKDALRAVG